MRTPADLPLPAHYFPFESGKYSTAPGLHKLGTDFDNGSADSRVFQLDDQWHHYRENKESCRRENPEKYYCYLDDKPESLKAVCNFIISRLTDEYPNFFSLEKQRGSYVFQSQLSDEKLYFDQEGKLLAPAHYTNLLDALAFQVQEDLAIWQMQGEQDWMSHIHLSAPNHWAPGDKTGQPFSSVHAPVAGMEQMRARYQPMLKSLLKGGTYVRFAWGLATDTRLNHHPEAPPGIKQSVWEGRSFDPTESQLYLRIERQTLSGLQGAQAVLFGIHTYFANVSTLNPLQKLQLRKALQSMSGASLAYKGLEADYGKIMLFLNS